MQDRQHASPSFVQSHLPWYIAAGAVLIYLLTLSHWVTINSLPFVSKVARWDWTLPLSAPVYYLVTYPIQWIPASWQPAALNLFSAVCAALTLALLARSVSLLPHDRTHAQRQRERSEFSLLSSSTAWLPPLFAVLICGLQLTFWEHSTAATSEALNLLIFAYAIRCLLEYRIQHRESWLFRMAFVYAIGVTNNWAMIGFFPLFLIALIWIKGFSFFQGSFMLRMAGCGLAGLLPYLILPLAWAMSDVGMITFWEALKAQWAGQKTFLLDTPQLRNRAFVLSLTSILPIFIMGIRWPSSFGDTSAAGAVLTNIMFRVIHVALMGVCLWVVFDQKFSPRALGLGLPFLTFYYLGALAVGYFAGYILLVFGEGRSRSSRSRSPLASLGNRAVQGALWVALAAIPAGLLYKNLGPIRITNGDLLEEFTAMAAQALPQQPSVVLSDDFTGLTLLEGYLLSRSRGHDHLLAHSRSLSIPNYHRLLRKRYPQRWPEYTANVPDGERVEDSLLLKIVMDLSKNSSVYYLHPSFGFFFEEFYASPKGLICQLIPYPSGDSLPPLISEPTFATNQVFWNKFEAKYPLLRDLSQSDSLDGRFLGQYYSRALNFWGVESQKIQRLKEAGKHFDLAANLNTNNKPAQVNFEYNHYLETGWMPTNGGTKISEKFGAAYRDWETMLVDNGPIDQPEYNYELGQIFLSEKLFRQAAIQFDRVKSLQPTNLVARLALANVYVKGNLAEKALEELAAARALEAPAADRVDFELGLARLEASAHFSRTNLVQAEQVLLNTIQKYPNQIGALDALVMFYGQTKRFDEALKTIDRILALSADNPQALINQATIHFNSTNYAAAQASLDRVLTRYPRNVPALLYKVFMQIEAKDFEKALATVEQVLVIDPLNHEGLLYKAVIHIETQEFAKALPPLDRLLNADPGRTEALQNRAIANLQVGNLDQAERDYELLRQQIARNYVAYFGLGEIAYRQNRRADAIEFYELYLQYAPATASPAMAEEKRKIEQRLAELKASSG